jgi:hypothetical protein
MMIQRSDEENQQCGSLVAATTTTSPTTNQTFLIFYNKQDVIHCKIDLSKFVS